jgi:hypothetical protein
MSVSSTIEPKPLAPFQPFAPRTGMLWSNVDEAIVGLKALIDAGPGASGVTAGAYGSASAVATFTVGADGRLTVAGSAAIQIAISAVTGLQAALDAKAAAVHSHAIADVTGLQAALDAKASATDLSNHLADTSDAHDASAISVTPTGDIAATDVQAAIAELDTEKQPASANLTEWSSLNPSANGGSLVTAVDYSAMRALLDLEAGTDFLSPAAIAAAYQPLDAQLTDVAGLAVTDGNFIVGNGTNFVGESGNTARTSLGLGTGDSPQFTNETLTGYQDMAEIAAPSNPAANVARFYCKDNGSGTTKLYFRDSAGTETELGAGGGAASLPPGFNSIRYSQAADTDHDITFAIGKCRDSTDAFDITLASAITKQIDAGWSVGNNAGGLDTGAVANTTFYYLWIIKRSDTAVVDALFSTSATAPTMPANYDQKQRVGWVLTDGSANILAFRQSAYDPFEQYFVVAIQDVNVGTQGTTQTARTLSVPPSALAIVSGYFGHGSTAHVALKPTFHADGTPSGTNPSWVQRSIAGGVNEPWGPVRVPADTSRQVATDSSASSTTILINTLGAVFAAPIVP